MWNVLKEVKITRGTKIWKVFSLGPVPRLGRVMVLMCLSVCVFVCLSVCVSQPIIHIHP